MTLTRRVSFSSGHRYWLRGLSDNENRALFGKWASPFNHGHNYILEASVRGKTDEQTGMVVNIKTLDDILQERVVEVFDQRSINDEVEEFIDISPTLENIGRVIMARLNNLPFGVELTRLRIYETPLLFADFDTNEETIVKLTRGYEFAASHRLQIDSMSDAENQSLFGKCNNENGHGHNYELEVTVTGIVDSRTGMLADIGEVDRVVRKEVVDRYDHKHLNLDLPEFDGINPTTEAITRTIWRRLNGKLPAKLDKVLVRETARNIFEYSGEDE